MFRNWTLIIADNGIEIVATAKVIREGLGRNIIDSLANQLDAKMQRQSSSAGTSVSILHSYGLI